MEEGRSSRRQRVISSDSFFNSRTRHEEGNYGQSEIGKNVVTVCSLNSITATCQIGYVLTMAGKGPRFIFN